MNQQKGNEGRTARAEARRVEMQKMVAQGRSNKDIAQVLGVTEKTVENNLALVRKQQPTVTDDRRQAAIDELVMLRDEVLSHRKGNKPLPLAAVDRLIKIAEVVMRLEGTAAPTKTISAHVDGVQVIPIEEQYEYKQAFAGLYDDERLEELDRVRARKRTCRVVMVENPFLLESGS